MAMSSVLEQGISSGIINATKNDINVLKNTMARAFVHEPMTNWIVKNDERVFERREIMFETILKNFGFAQGMVHTNEERTACAVWLPPKSQKKKKNSFTAFSLLPAYIKAVGIERIIKVMKGASIAEKYQPDFDFYYLMSLGVLPELQGKGLASSLIQPVLDMCDMQKIPAYLETSTEEGLAFYKRHGFKVRHDIFELNKLPRTWTMLREPKS